MEVKEEGKGVEKEVAETMEEEKENVLEAPCGRRVAPPRAQ